MNSVIPFIDDHFFELVLFTFLWNALIVAASVIYRKRKMALQTPFDETSLHFFENGISANSYKNWYTRIGGAANCINVSVNEEEVYIRPFSLFKYGFLPEIFDLEHRIPRERVVSVVKKDSWLVGRDIILITYALPNNKNRTIKLYMRQAELFIASFPDVHTAAD